MIEPSIYKNSIEIECVTWTDEQGNHSMIKSAYDEMIAAQEAPILSITTEPPTEQTQEGAE
jgi:hypothetical protein